MARNKNNSDGGGFWLLVIIFAIATIITVGSVLYIVLALLMWGMRSRQSKRLGEALSNSYFISTREEIQKIMEDEKGLADESRYLADLKKEGSDLNLVGDGTRYDGRNRLGRELNEKIPQSQREINALKTSLDEFRSYKDQRRKRYLDVKVGKKSWQTSFIFLFFTIFIFVLYQPTWLAGWIKFIDKFVWIDFIKRYSLPFGILSVSSIFSIGMLFLSGFYHRLRLESTLKSGEKPEKHTAILYTEALAAETEIGVYSSDTLKRAWMIYNEREGLSKSISNIEKSTLTEDPVQTSESLQSASLDGEAPIDISDQELEEKVKTWMRSSGHTEKSLFRKLAMPLLSVALAISAVIFIYTSEQTDIHRASMPSTAFDNASTPDQEVISQTPDAGNFIKKSKKSPQREILSQVTLRAFECGDFCHLEYVDADEKTYSAICMDIKECKSWGDNPESFNSLIGTKADLIVSEKFIENGNEMMDNIVGMTLLGGAPAASPTVPPAVVAAAVPSVRSTPAVTSAKSVTSVPHLCTASESPVFACSTGKKRASICASRSGSVDRLLYRLAPLEGAPEMEYPGVGVAAAAAFRYGTQPMPNNQSTAFLSFDKGDYRYVVYADGDAQRQGIMVERGGKRIANLRCQSDAMAAFDPLAWQRMGLAQDSRGLQLP